MTQEQRKALRESYRRRKSGLCAIGLSLNPPQLWQMTQLHHARIHDKEWVRNKYPLFVDSVYNVVGVHHDLHQQYGGWGRWPEWRVAVVERGLMRHPVQARLANPGMSKARLTRIINESSVGKSGHVSRFSQTEVTMAEEVENQGWDGPTVGGLMVPTLQDRTVPDGYDVKEALGKHKRLAAKTKGNLEEMIHAYWLARQVLQPKAGRPSKEATEAEAAGTAVTWDGYCGEVQRAGGFSRRHVDRVLALYDPETKQIEKPAPRPAGSGELPRNGSEPEPRVVTSQPDLDGDDGLGESSDKSTLGLVQEAIQPVVQALDAAMSRLERIVGAGAPLAVGRVRESVIAMHGQLQTWLPGYLVDCPTCDGSGTVGIDPCRTCGGTGKTGMFRGYQELQESAKAAQ